MSLSFELVKLELNEPPIVRVGGNGAVFVISDNEEDTIVSDLTERRDVFVPMAKMTCKREGSSSYDPVRELWHRITCNVIKLRRQSSRVIVVVRDFPSLVRSGSCDVARAEVGFLGVAEEETE